MIWGELFRRKKQASIKGFPPMEASYLDISDTPTSFPAPKRLGLESEKA